MKKVTQFYIIVLLLVFLNSVQAQTQITLNIDYSLSSEKPDANIKRGYVLRDAIAVKNNNILDDLDKVKDLGCELVNIPRDLNQFDVNYSNGNYYKSYRSIGPLYFGGDGQDEEFSEVNSSVVTRANTDFVDICEKAKDNGMQMIIQVSGTPVEGKNNGSVTQLFPLDPNRQFHESARFYALPAPGEYNAVATKVADWMAAVKNGVGANNIIWAGQQEPSHTAGYPNGNQTRAGTEANIRDYAKVWKPIAQEIQNQNLGKIGGIQLNEVQIDYEIGVSAIKDNNVPINFFTIQNYKGEHNYGILNEAVQELNKYTWTSGKKVIFNRYDFKSGFSTKQERYNTSAGMTQFLKNELILLNNAAKIYGYCLFTGALGENMMDEVMKFLNKMPVRRRKIDGIGQGINAWCTANSSDFYMALWNTANGSREVGINLKKFPVAYNTHQMNIRKASGNSLANYGNATWTPGTAGKIENIILQKDEFVLIQLNSDGSAARLFFKEIESKNQLEVACYPNPAKGQLNFVLPQDVLYDDLKIYDISGKLMKVVWKNRLQYGVNQLDVSALKKGVYVLKSTINSKKYTKCIVISD